MDNLNIEVEGGELMLESEEGHYAIIPAKDRQKALNMIKDGCNDCINSYIKSLPKEADYADNGTLIPNTEPVLPPKTPPILPKTNVVTDFGSNTTFGNPNIEYLTKYDDKNLENFSKTIATDQPSFSYKGREIANNKYIKPAEAGIASKIVKSSARTIGIPENFSQLLSLAITRDSMYGINDMPEGSKIELFKSLENAKVHPRNKGKGGLSGTEYMDFSDAILESVVNKKETILSSIKASYTSPQYVAATTSGRVSFKYNKESDSYDVYDAYDFSKTKEKEGESFYGKFRHQVGEVLGTDAKPKYIGTLKGSDYRKKDSVGVPFSKIYTEIKDVPQPNIVETKKSIGNKVNNKSSFNSFAAKKDNLIKGLKDTYTNYNPSDTIDSFKQSLSSFSNNLSKGIPSSKDSIIALQQALNKANNLGNDTADYANKLLDKGSRILTSGNKLVTDGIIGKKTIKEIQRNLQNYGFKLEDDGILGDITKKAIEEFNKRNK